MRLLKSDGGGGDGAAGEVERAMEDGDTEDNGSRGAAGRWRQGRNPQRLLVTRRGNCRQNILSSQRFL